MEQFQKLTATKLENFSDKLSGIIWTAEVSWIKNPCTVESTEEVMVKPTLSIA
jgi:hypothetical protein